MGSFEKDAQANLMPEYVDTRAILQREYAFWENAILGNVRAENEQSAKSKEVYRIEYDFCQKCGKRVGPTTILCYVCYMAPENKINRSNAQKRKK